MVGSIPISLSGLKAQQQRLLASASNIANLTTSGPNPASTPDGTSSVYKPLTVTQKSVSIPNQGGSGTSATISQQEDGTTLIFDPQSNFADSDGLVAIPDISLEQEIVGLVTAEIAYKANAFAIKVASEIEDTLIDELA